MISNLRFLVVEDSENDALLMLRELRKGGYEPDYERVDTKAAMMNALQSREWDVIICDYNMPTFRGDRALSLLKESGLDVPFILLSGTIGEEIAVDMMKAGAHDYIMKDNLARLVPAIQRELRDAKNRKEKRDAQAALQQSEEKYRMILHSMHDLVFVIDKNDCFSQYYTSSEELLLVSPKEFIGRPVSKVLPQLVTEQFTELSQRVRDTGESEAFDYQLETGGQTHWFSAVLSLHEDGESIVQLVRNITGRKQAEDALGESEKKYRLLAENTFDCIWQMDLNTDFTYVNPAVFRVFGFTPKEWVGSSLGEHCSSEDMEFMSDLMMETMRKGPDATPETFEVRMLRKNSKEINVEITAELILDKDNNPLRFQGTTRNITERKRAEKALVESEREKSAILNGMKDVVIYYDNPDMKIVWANKAAGESVNLSVNELIGKHCYKIWHQFDKSWDSCPVVRAFETGQPEEEEMTTPDGRIWFIRGWPVKDDEGRTIGVVKVSRNVTEQKRAEEALRESEEWFRAIYEESPIAINVFDPNGNLIHANPALLSLAGVSNVEDMKDFNIFNDPNMPVDVIQRMRKGERARFRSVIDFAKVKETGLYDTSKSGVCYIETGASPLKYGEDEALHGYMVQMVDVTERVLAEANTKAAAETAMLYLDLMGHDIRNHLQAIIMGIEILEQLDFRPEIREMIDIVVDSVECSRNLIKKVQATRELLLVPLSSTSLREALEDCLQVLNETYDDIQIEVNLGAQQPTVFADKYLGNLLMNILENAILHNDKKTRRVWLDLREVEEGYEVAIADNGPGILDKRKESLFDQSRRFGGVGVHQALKIAQKYGGRMSVHDRVHGDSNQGAEFHIWLPRSTSSA